MQNRNREQTEQDYIENWKAIIPPNERHVFLKYEKENPVDILKICKELNIGLYATSIETILYGWIEYNQEDSIFEIYLNPQYSEPQQRYTLAHELSHFLFHKKSIVGEGQLDKGYINKNYLDVKEWQADLYASEILIPTVQINKMIYENNQYLNDDIGFSMKIKDKFKVSLEVALKRARRSIEAFSKI